MLEIYGADVIVTDRLEGTDGAARRARELVAAQPERYFYADQYSNPANPEAHRDTRPTHNAPDLYSPNP